MGVTGSHAFAAGALLTGLLRHDPGFDGDVVLFHDGLTGAQEAAFLTLCPRLRFRAFTADDVARRLDLPRDHPRLAGVLARGSAMMLAKLDLPDLLAETDRCLWLDADILVRGNWSAAWDFGPLAWRPLAGGALGRRDDALRALPDLPRDTGVPLPNGGVVGVSRGLPPGAARDLWALARRLIAGTRAETVDELALYAYAAARGIAVTRLPWALNHPVTRTGAAGAVLLHAIGPCKFWNATPLRQLWPEWQVHHAAWVAAGGDAWDGPVLMADVHPEDPGDLMQAVRHRALWTAFADRLLPDLPPGLHIDPRLDSRHLRLVLHGHPAARHLRLAMTPNPRRIAMELRLPGALRDAALRALRAGVPGLRGGDVLTLPLDDLPAALRAVAAAVRP